MAYSVPLRTYFKIFGPKPIEKTSTLTPKNLAIKKWPNSWKKIRGPRNITKMRIP